MSAETKIVQVSCCIAGGGPAGVMLGFLLARAGIEVAILEKHLDFFRDFRGDTIHPSTMELMYELGLLDQFLKIPHQEIKKISVHFNDEDITLGDFSHLKVHTKWMGIMPQWDFLNFLAKQGAQYPGFKLLMGAEVTDIVKEGNVVKGVIARTKDGPLKILAPLTVGSDGRSSVVRAKAGMKVIDTGAPIDVIWFRLPYKQSDPPESFGRFYNGRVMVHIQRGDYWQCAYVIEKDGAEKIKQNGIEAFRKELSAVSSFLADRVDQIKDWNDISVLSVKIDHLERWYDHGLLCIGDAAHAMSPIGGVGVNLAVQDAVATAAILYPVLQKGGTVPVSLLKKVQQRRQLPMRVIQRIQVFIQKGMITKHRQGEKATLPFPFRLLKRFAILRRIPARIIGMGIRPEHIHTPESKK